MLVNVSNDRLDAVIKGYAERRARGIAQRSLTTMRAEILKQFEENDTRRGIPYLAVTENVSTDYLIRGSGKASYKGDEEPWVGEYDNLDFSYDGEEEVYEEELLDDSDDVEEEIEGVSQGMQDLIKSLSSGGAVGGMEHISESAEDSATGDENSTDYAEPVTAAPDEDEVEYPPHAVDSNGFDVYSEDGEFVDADDYSNETVEDTTDESEDNYEEFDFDEDDEEDEEDVEVEEGVEVEDPTPTVSNSLPSLGGSGGLPSIASAESQTLPSLGGSSNPSSNQGIAEKKVVRKVIKRVVKVKLKPIKEESFADLVERKRETVNTRTSRTKPQDRAAEEGIRTLRDLVKRHPNCDIKLAEQYFPRKEIEREVRMGRVFLKADKLTI